MSERAALEEQQSRFPATWVLVRDVGSWVFGWTLTFLEVSVWGAREAVLVLCGTLVVAPGAAVGASALLNRRAGSTPESPSSSPPGSA